MEAIPSLLSIWKGLLEETKVSVLGMTGFHQAPRSSKLQAGAWTSTVAKATGRLGAAASDPPVPAWGFHFHPVSSDYNAAERLPNEIGPL